MELLAALTLVAAPIVVLAVYLTLSAVFLLELRKRERHEDEPPVDRPKPAPPARSPRPQPCRVPRSWRSRKSSARSATSRHPLSAVRECPRSGSTEYSVAPVLRR